MFTVTYWISLDFKLPSTAWQFEVTFQGEYEKFEEETDQFLVDVVNDYIPLNGIDDFDESLLKDTAQGVHITYSE